VRTNTCPVFATSRLEVFDAIGDFTVACAPKPVRSSSAHEHPTSLGAALAGAVQYCGHQCALQRSDRRGSAGDRRRRASGAPLSRRRRDRRGLCDGVLGGVGLCPANRRGAGVRAVGAHCSALPRALCARRDGCARSRGRVASWPTTYLRETSAQHRDIKMPGK
jgi:hypothetical protein